METMPEEVVRVRGEICHRCDEQCSQFKHGIVFLADPCAACPRNWPSRWGRFNSNCQNTIVETKPFGLGDLVASIAQPIAKAIDAVVGTNTQGCGGCKQRRDALNKLVPRL